MIFRFNKEKAGQANVRPLYEAIKMAKEIPTIDLSEDNLTRIRKIADKATPGPYAIDSPPHGSPHVVANPGTLEKRYIAYCCPFPGPDEQHMNNARFLAVCSPETINAMISEIERLRSELSTFVRRHGILAQKLSCACNNNGCPANSPSDCCGGNCRQNAVTCADWECYSEMPACAAYRISHAEASSGEYRVDKQRLLKMHAEVVRIGKEREEAVANFLREHGQIKE